MKYTFCKEFNSE